MQKLKNFLVDKILIWYTITILILGYLSIKTNLWAYYLGVFVICGFLVIILIATEALSRHTRRKNEN